jgi:ADP-ribose pyrophosphatase
MPPQGIQTCRGAFVRRWGTGVEIILSESSENSSSEYPDTPRVAVGAVVFKENKVLLVRRGQPPAEGVWAIPGGRIELGETLQKAAEREILEETGLNIRAKHPVFTFDAVVRDDNGKIRFHYVIVDLIADYVSGDIQPGDDALEARWVSKTEMNNLHISHNTRQVLKDLFNFGD